MKSALPRIVVSTLAAACTLAALGCSVDATNPSPPSPTSTASALSVATSADATARGVASYRVSVAEGITNVDLMDANGTALGVIQSYGVDGGKHIAFAHGNHDVELEVRDGTVSTWVNGSARGTSKSDSPGSAPGMADVSDDLALLTTVAADPALARALEAHRGVSPDLEADGRCTLYEWTVGCTIYAPACFICIAAVL